MRRALLLAAAAAAALPGAAEAQSREAELAREVLSLRSQLAAAERRLHEERALSRALSGAPDAAVPPPAHNGSAPPPGAYLQTCKGCTMYGETLACVCSGKRTSIAPWQACEQPFNITDEGGFLTCDWRQRPPPRVGKLTVWPNGSLPDIDSTCRSLIDTSFVAPQYTKRGDPIAALQLPAAAPWWAPRHNLSGQWLCAPSGDFFGGQLEKISIAAAGGLADTTLESYRLSCLSPDGAPCRGYGPPDEADGAAGWRTATARLSPDRRSLSLAGASGVRPATAQLGVNFSSVLWEGGGECRRAPPQTALDASIMACCRHCTNTTACRAWTMDATGAQSNPSQSDLAQKRAVVQRFVSECC